VYTTSGAPILSSGKVTTMYNWLTPFRSEIPPQQNFLIYMDGSSVIRCNLEDQGSLTPTFSTLVSGLSGTRGLTFAELGQTLYFCGFDAYGNGTMQAHVLNLNDAGGFPAVDTAFRGPLTVTSITATDVGPGQCSSGTHYLGFIFQSRSGFAGQPSPVASNSLVFTPVSITLNSPGRTIRLTITLNTPPDAGPGSAFYPIITRADNPNAWFFVPGASGNLPANAPNWTQFIDISVSDEDLAASATPADDYFNRLVQQPDGSGPFNPQCVASYGKRMVYGFNEKIYVSDIDDPQALSEDFHVIYGPSRRKVVAARQFGSDLLVFGDRWTARFTDNGDVPATWATPVEVSNFIGTLSPTGVESQTGGQWIWVAAESGLYLFVGQYSDHPISFYQSDVWKRINWNAAYAVQIADDVTNLKVHVAVPLDGATEPTHDLVWDYTNGMTFDTCDFSMDNFSASTFSSIRTVRDPISKRTSVYIGPSSAGNVIQLDSSKLNDVNPSTGSQTPIHSAWESSYVLLPGEAGTAMARLGAVQLWIRGAGQLIHTWFGLDRVASRQPLIFANGDAISQLSPSPGQVLLAKGDLPHVENFTLRLETNALDSWFSFSGLKPYWRPDLWIR
jgi:hypothetical protein